MNVPGALDARFRDRAAAEGLLDVAYDFADSPVGGLLLAATTAGVCRICFDPDPESAVDQLAATYGTRVLRSARPVDRARRELDEYFGGTRKEFDLELDLTQVAPFQRLVLGALALVPYGGVATYGALAERIGRPGAARAVGGALNRNPLPLVLPCHRILGAGSRLVGYAGGLERKRALLALEGVTLTG